MNGINEIQRINNSNNKVLEAKHGCTFFAGRNWKKMGAEVAKSLVKVALVISAIAFVVLCGALGALNMHLIAKLSSRHGFHIGFHFLRPFP